MSETVIMVGAIIGALFIILLGILAMFARFYRQVEQGKALIVNTTGKEAVVAFTGTMVFPVINRAETMDLSVKTIDIDRRGKEGLICNDNIRADINVTFFVRVNKTADDVLKVAQSIGCARASDPKTLEELFTSKFAEALKTVGKHFNFEELYTKRDDFKDKIIEVIGKDLNGFILDDAAIDYLEQTPLEALDKDNIMDADGIRKITEITVQHNVKTNELRQRERMEMGSENLKSDEAIFAFEQRRAEAEAKKHKEIAIAQSREQNEAARVASEESKKTHIVHHKNEEEALIAEQAKQRGVAVAQKNREREVALVGIARDKEVEQQKKEIADVIRARIAVEKTVAVEEEHIKDVRAIAGANRDRDALKIHAEAEAATALVKQVKAAEAAEEVAKHAARQKSITADAELETADKVARAKIRLAEGTQAEAAAEGLARARVKEAEAIATEKQGLVDARIALEKMQSMAAGEERQGLAKVKVKEADAQAIEKLGVAEAAALREKLVAEASGEEQKGLALAKVTREKLVAEAAGIAEKAASMKALDEAGREHEEFRLRLDKEKTIELETIHAKTSVASAQAQILAQAFSNAKFNIVGGDGAFFERFVKAVSVGQAIDGAVDASPHVKSLVESAMRPDDEAVLGLVEKLLVNDPAATARLKGAMRSGPTGAGE